MEYIDMTMAELERERQKIIKEIERRIAIAQRRKELERCQFVSEMGGGRCSRLRGHPGAHNT